MSPTPIDVHDIVNVQKSFEETGDKETRIQQIADFYKTFDSEGVLSDRRLESQKANISMNQGLQYLQHEHNDNPQSLNPHQTSSEAWPDWDETFAASDAEVLFRDTNDRDNPFIGVPGQGGIMWSEGMNLIDENFPDYKPSAVDEPSEALDAINEVFPGYIPPTGHGANGTSQFTVSDKLAPDGSSQQLEVNESEVENYPPTPGRCASPTPSEGSYYEPPTRSDQLSVDENALYPPTPGVPTDINDEDDGDITMDDVEPAKALAEPLPTLEHQGGIVNADANVNMNKDDHVEPNTAAGSERVANGTGTKHAGNDRAEIEVGPEDVVMEESNGLAIENTEIYLPEQPKNSQLQDFQHSESTHLSQPRNLFPPFPYSSDAHISRASVINVLASSVPLSIAPSTEGKPLTNNYTNMDLTNKEGRVTKGEKNSKASSSKDSAAVHKTAEAPTPQTPPRSQKQNQASTAPSPVTAPSPLKLLQQSVKMGRKSSFSKGQESSADETSKTTGKKSAKSGVVGKTDDELLEDFVFIPEAALEKMKAPEVKSLIRSLESLRVYHNGLVKKSMIQHYMQWQKGMQTRQGNLRIARAKKAKAAAKIKAAAEAEKEPAGLGSEEEDDDPDAEAADDDDYPDFADPYSPANGKVTPGPPIKSPFTDQPRTTKQTPFMNKLTKAAEASSSSPSVRRRAGRSRTPFDSQAADEGQSEEDSEPEVYKNFLAEKVKEQKDKSKRLRRSVSRPATYKE